MDQIFYIKFEMDLKFSVTDIWVEDRYAFREVVDEDNSTESVRSGIGMETYLCLRTKGKKSTDEN